MTIGLETRLRAIEESLRPSDPFVDAAVRLVVYARGPTIDGIKTDITSRVFGGRWNRHKRIMSPPDHSTQIIERPVSREQMMYCEDYTPRLMGKGGRGGGKSEALAQKCECVLLDRPDQDILILSPDYPHTRIVWRKILRRISQWIMPRGIHMADRELHTVFGSIIAFKSAHDADSVRGFEAAVGLLDEEKDISAEAYDNFLLCIRKGGATPHIAGVGTPEAGGEYEERWNQHHTDPNAAQHSFPSRSNPFISHEVFDLAAKAMDEKRYRQEVLAEFVAMAIDEYVWRDEFDRDVHGIKWPVPGWIDITRQVTKRFGKQYKNIAGIDYNDDYPNVAYIYRVYAPDVVGDPRRWVATDVVRAHGHASWLGQAMKDKGYNGDNTLVIDDASGEYNVYRGGKKANSSARLMSSLGFNCMHPKRNPMIKDRAAAHLAKLKPVNGKASWFYDKGNKDLARYVEACAMKLRWNNGKLEKSDGVDHDYDAMTYPIALIDPAASANVPRLKAMG